MAIRDLVTFYHTRAVSVGPSKGSDCSLCPLFIYIPSSTWPRSTRFLWVLQFKLLDFFSLKIQEQPVTKMWFISIDAGPLVHRTEAGPPGHGGSTGVVDSAGGTRCWGDSVCSFNVNCTMLLMDDGFPVNSSYWPTKQCSLVGGWNYCNTTCITKRYCSRGPSLIHLLAGQLDGCFAKLCPPFYVQINWVCDGDWRQDMFFVGAIVATAWAAFVWPSARTGCY